MNSTLRSLSSAWPWTTVDLLNHLWQSTVVGVVVLTVLWFGRGLSARTRRALGWLALAKFALPAGFLVERLARFGASSDRWVETVARTRPMLLPAFVVAAPTADAPARLPIGLIFGAIWLVGFVVLFATWLSRSRRLRRQIFAEMQPVSAAVGLRLDAAAARTGLPEAPRCLAVDRERAPGVLGVVAPVVIVPRGLEVTLAPAELESVLIHEFVHVQRRDNLWCAAQAFFASLFWFHPVVWLLNRRIGIETEQSCDERVVELTGDADTYAGGIVKAVQHALGVAQPGLIGATTPPVIARIKNIFSHHPRRDRPMVRGAVLTGGALLIAFSGYAGSFAVPALAQSSLAPAAPVATAVDIAPPPPAPPPTAAAEVTLSVDFPNEDLRQVIRNVADLFQIHVVIPVDLTGKATVNLKNATWRQIYHIILAPVGYTFVEEGNLVKIVPAAPLTSAAPSATPVALGSLPARAVEARLIAQADDLKARAEKLQQEVEAYRAAGAGGADDSAHLEAAAKAAALAAIDARRQAVDAATKATEDAVRQTEIAASRTVQIQREQTLVEERTKQQELPSERQRVIAAEARAQQQAMIAGSDADPQLRAREGAAPTPTVGTGNAVVERALNPQARSAADETRAAIVKVFELTELDRRPVPTYQARPLYPFALRRSNTSGEATIDFIVNERGDVVGASAIKFTHQEFADAATAAVAKWKFRPGRLGGAPVATHMQVPIVFEVNRDEQPAVTTGRNADDR